LRVQGQTHSIQLRQRPVSNDTWGSMNMNISLPAPPSSLSGDEFPSPLPAEDMLPLSSMIICKGKCRCTVKGRRMKREQGGLFGWEITTGDRSTHSFLILFYVGLYRLNVSHDIFQWNKLYWNRSYLTLVFCLTKWISFT
jgi:hypothetical protein